MKIFRFLATCSLLTLTACSGGTVKETLGIGQKAPDEFRVVSRPPLSVPPQFNLRPPSNNATSPTVIPADKQAKSIITGSQETVNGDSRSVDTAVIPVDSAALPSATTEKNKKSQNIANENKSASESQFLQNIGVDKADPKVRDDLTQQKLAEQETQEEDGWWSKVSKTNSKKDTLVDAKKEAERIKANKAKNKPVTEGETPDVKDKDHGVLGNIFGW